MVEVGRGWTLNGPLLAAPGLLASSLSAPAALLRQHAVMVGMAALPLVVFAAAAVSRPAPSPPVVPTLVQSEGITAAQRLDIHTFRRRWEPVADMPVTEMRAREHRWLGPGGAASASASRNDGSRLVPTITYREVRSRTPQPVGDEDVGAGTVSGADVALPSRHRLRSRPAALDICARHNMRKVHYGKRWRCRR